MKSRGIVTPPELVIIRQKKTIFKQNNFNISYFEGLHPQYYLYLQISCSQICELRRRHLINLIIVDSVINQIVLPP